MNNNEILMHSDTYLGLDFSDELRHWKYIKKERVNGKWVYYYKDDITANLNKEGNKAFSNQVDAQRKYNDKKAAYEQSRNDFNRMKYMDDYYKDKDALEKKYKENWYDSKKTKQQKRLMKSINPINYNKRAENDMNQKRMEYSSASSELDQAKKQVKNISNQQRKNASLGPRVQRAISKALVKTLNNASNSIYNGKKLLKKIFK